MREFHLLLRVGAVAIVLGHDCMHQRYVGRDSIGHDCIGHDCIGRDCIRRDRKGRDCMAVTAFSSLLPSSSYMRNDADGFDGGSGGGDDGDDDNGGGSGGGRGDEMLIVPHTRR